MTTYNVYIAHGERDGIAVMKIGKSKDLHQRARQLGLAIDMFVPYPDEDEAFAFETCLRDFVVDKGGKMLPGKNDWFYFDSRLYKELYAVVDKMAELKLKLKLAQAEIERLKEELAAERKEKYRLIEEIIRASR